MLDILLDIYTNQLLVFLLVLTRVSGLVTIAPVWGSRSIPLRVRAFLAIGIALIISPLFWYTPIDDPANLVHLVMLLTHEYLLGLSLGLAVMICFAGLELAGQVVGQMTGISLADIASPDSESGVPVFSHFLHLVMLSVFLVTGGLQHLLDAFYQVFQRVPPGAARFHQPWLEALVEIASFSFTLGLQIAAPMMVALMLTIVVTGLISRTLPQLNVLAVGFNINCIIMLAALLLSLGVLARLFEHQSRVAIDLIRPVLESVWL